jgi:glycosyltransferase involved in cell wall biosynthesis
VPFFSVVIPTRNRPQFVGDAVASVIGQDDPDLECIVSDNFNEPSTRAAIEPFLADPRLRYLRTDRLLSMPDHWEFATEKATGEYVLVLADRKLLLQGALRRLRRELTRRPGVEVFSGGVRVYDNRGRRMGWRPPRFPTRIYPVDELLRSFLCDNVFSIDSLDLVFPKTLNGGYKRDFARRVREGGRRYFNNPGVTTPDYSSFLVNCAMDATALHVGDPIILTQGEQDSNGRRLGAGDVDAYIASLGHSDLYAGVPLQLPFIYNMLTIDFIRIRSVFGGELSKWEPDWPSYFRTLYAEWRMKERAAVLPPEELRRLESQWAEACQHKLGPDAVDELRRPVAPARRPLDPVGHARDFLSHRFSHVSWINRLVRYRFERALDAAGFS